LTVHPGKGLSLGSSRNEITGHEITEDEVRYINSHNRKIPGIPLSPPEKVHQHNCSNQGDLGNAGKEEQPQSQASPYGKTAATVEVDTEEGKKVEEDGLHAGEDVPVNVSVRKVERCAAEREEHHNLFILTRDIRKEIFRYQSDQQATREEEDEREDNDGIIDIKPQTKEEGKDHNPEGTGGSDTWLTLIERKPRSLSQIPGIHKVDVGIIKRENMVDPWIRKEESHCDETYQDEGSSKGGGGSHHLK
jgi:hypothetical protein